jgi:DNA polymerase-3 subunit epsilon
MVPQRLLILDTETTGLDPQTDRCIEVGAVLFDVAHRSVLSQISFLLPCEHNAAKGVNGIEASLTQQPHPWRQGLQCFEALLDAADLVVAHNAAFDRQWFGIDPLPPIHKSWLCTMEDIRWPADRQLRPNPSVRDLALAYAELSPTASIWPRCSSVALIWSCCSSKAWSRAAFTGLASPTRSAIGPGRPASAGISR